METPIQEIRCDELLKRPIHALDGELGSLNDILFDDETWSIRYFVVKTGGWLSGRKVLVLPNSVDRSELPGDSVPVALTQEQIRNSPDINTDLPVSKQHELDLGSYYGMSPLSPPPIGFGAMPESGGLSAGALLPMEAVIPTGDDGNSDPHLRSIREVRKLPLHTSDGEDLQIEDFTIDWKVLRLTSMVVRVGDDKPVLLPLDAVRSMRWEDQRVSVNWSRRDVEMAPASLL